MKNHGNRYHDGDGYVRFQRETTFLEKKDKKIARLQAQHETRNKDLLDGDVAVHKMDDFTIDLDTNLEIGYQPADVNAYLIELGVTRLDLERSTDGFYHCPDTECSYRASSLAVLKRHFQIHSGEKPFQCKLCNAQFARKTICLDHIRTHDDKFKLKCSLCDARFSSRELLINHGNRYHNGDGYVRLQCVERPMKRPRI